MGKQTRRKSVCIQKKQREKTDRTKEFLSLVSDSSDDDVPEFKMESETSEQGRDATRRVTRGRKHSKKEKTQAKSHSAAVAGPSRFIRCRGPVIVEERGFMVLCTYKKTEKKIKKTPTKPYQVKWGQNVLDEMFPNIDKTKSILKSPTAEKKEKPRARFSNTTVYYFERAERKIPPRGDMTVHMEQEHFYASFSSVDAFEEQKEERRKKTYSSSRKRRGRKLTLPPSHEDGVLHTIDVPTDLAEEDDQTYIEGIQMGCSCVQYCDPAICECHLSGKQCEVIKGDYPCGCTLRYCKNAHGRKAYNARYVRKLFVKVAKSSCRGRGVRHGRVSKRKQPAPRHYNRRI